MAKILLIDDAPEVRDLLTSTLKDKHEIHTVAGWAEANPYIFKDNMDLILIDVNMPGTKGDQIAQVLQETVKCKKLNIVLFSAMDEIDLKRKAKESKVSGYIQKTFDLDLLLARISKYLENTQRVV